MMEAVRTFGLAARFVTGYLHVPHGPHPGEAERHGGGNTHAWLQVYLPGAGWVEFDPTNGIVGSRGLIRVAVVRDPAMAVPLSGSWNGSRRRLPRHGRQRPCRRNCPPSSAPEAASALKELAHAHPLWLSNRLRLLAARADAVGAERASVAGDGPVDAAESA